MIAQNLREGDELISVALSAGDDEFIIGTRDGMSIRFSEQDVRSMGRNASGVRAIKLSEGDCVVDMSMVKPGSCVIAITENGMGKRTEEGRLPRSGPRRQGHYCNEYHRKNRQACLPQSFEGNEDLMLIRDDGVVIRVPVDTISVISRNTQGVRLMKIDEGHRVASVALAPHNDDEPQKGGGKSPTAKSNANDNADSGKTAPSDTAENSDTPEDLR